MIKAIGSGLLLALFVFVAIRKRRGNGRRV